MPQSKKFPISVLIIDDEPLIVEQLSQILQRRVKTLYTASNGKEGLEYFQNEPIDLIISDVDMPMMNGIELLTHVRAHDPQLPVILSTGLKNLDVLIAAIEQGITAFLPKPLNKKELISKIEEIARTKALEEEVRQSNLLLEQYKTIVDVSSIVSKTDPQGIITYVNDTFCKISGYKREELIGKPHNIVRDPSMPSNVFRHMWGTILAKKTWRGIVNNRAKNGSRYTVKTTITPVLDEKGNIVEYIGLREDISDTIRKEEKIRNERKKLDDILNHVDSIVALVSVTEKLKFVNQKFFDIFAYRDFDDYRSKHECICDIFEKKEGFLQQKMGEVYWVEYLLQNPDQSNHAIMIDKEGKEREFSVTLQRIHTEEKEVFVVTMDDVTELQRIKEEAKAAANMKGEFLANMSHEIRTPMNGILGFAALLGNTQLSEQQKRYLDIINSSTQTLLGIVNDILDFSKLESGKFELDYTDVNPFVEFDKIGQLFSAVMAEKEITFDVIIDPSISESIEIDLLRTRQVLSNLLSNAVKFTPKGGKIAFYTTLIRSTNGGNRIRMGVKDSGIGIPSQQQQKIFEAFSQADSSITRKFGGTGLGLSISSHLVSLMGGQLQVESEEGKGSDFYFEIEIKMGTLEHSLSSFFQTQKITLLPGGQGSVSREEQVKAYFEKLRLPYRLLEKGAAVEPSNPDEIYIAFSDGDPIIIDTLVQNNTATILICMDESIPVSAPNIVAIHHLEHNMSALYNALLQTAKESAFKNGFSVKGGSDVRFSGKILVAEDNDVNQMLIREFLHQYGLEPVIVENGRQAVDQLESHPYDLVLMDVNMPVMGGIEALRIIKEKNIQTPIVALTANSMAGDAERFLEEGFDGYLSKPIVIEHLRKVLERYLPAEQGESLALPAAVAATESSDETAGILDMERIKKELSLPETIIYKLLKAYLDSSNGSLAELEKAVMKNDAKAIEQAAHYIKGSAGNLRFTPISQLANEMERLSKLNADADYTLLYQQMNILVKTVQNEIRELLEMTGV